MFNNINVQIKRVCLTVFSAYGRPINVCLSQRLSTVATIFHFQEGNYSGPYRQWSGYLRTYCRSCPSRAISAIFKSKAMPLCWVPSKSPGPRSFKSAGYLETIVRAYHNLQTFPGIFRQFITGHQNTINGSAPRPTRPRS